MSVISDPLSDMLVRLRNAGKAQHPDCAVPASKLKAAVADVLRKEGYIRDFAVEGEGPARQLRIGLKYQQRRPVIAGLRRVSKPSRRVYVGAQDIPRVMGGLGVVVLSTPQGIMSGAEARKRGVGGEVLCCVW